MTLTTKEHCISCLKKTSWSKRCFVTLHLNYKDSVADLFHLFLDINHNTEFMAIHERIPFRDRENPMWIRLTMRMILHYRFEWQSIHALSDCLELDHVTVRSCATVLCDGIFSVRNRRYFMFTGQRCAASGMIINIK